MQLILIPVPFPYRIDLQNPQCWVLAGSVTSLIKFAKFPLQLGLCPRPCWMKILHRQPKFIVGAIYYQINQHSQNPPASSL